MSREQRGPNEKLGTVLALAGISNAGLARRVNDLGAQRGLTLRYDKTSVARWVSKGMVPQGAAPHLIAAAIGQKLGRPVPLHEIGLADADPAPEVGLAFPRDVGQAVRSATELYRLDLAGRRAGSGGIWQSGGGSVAGSANATPATVTFSAVPWLTAITFRRALWTRTSCSQTLASRFASHPAAWLSVMK